MKNPLSDRQTIGLVVVIGLFLTAMPVITGSVIQQPQYEVTATPIDTTEEPTELNDDAAYVLNSAISKNVAILNGDTTDVVVPQDVTDAATDQAVVEVKGSTYLLTISQTDSMVRIDSVWSVIALIIGGVPLIFALTSIIAETI